MYLLVGVLMLAVTFLLVLNVKYYKIKQPVCKDRWFGKSAHAHGRLPRGRVVRMRGCDVRSLPRVLQVVSATSESGVFAAGCALLRQISELIWVH